VSTQSQAKLQWTLNDLKEMHRIGLIVEYSRMKVPSLSRGCEIAQFLFAIPLQSHNLASTNTHCFKAD
jgi:hypothetical protein